MKTLKTTAYFVCAIIFIALVSEGFFRLYFNLRGYEIRYWQLASPGGYEPSTIPGHPFLPWSFNPGFKQNVTLSGPYYKGADPVTGTFTVNSFGFRGRENISQKKPGGTYRIECFGGSTTICRIGEPYTWPERLQSLLRSHYKTENIEVLNFGISWAFSAYSLVNFELRGLDFNPDMVIVYHGINDLARLGYPDFRGDYVQSTKDLNYPYSLLNKIPPWFFRSYVFSVSTGLIAKNAFNITPGDLSKNVFVDSEKARNKLEGLGVYKRNLRNIGHICRGNGIDLVLASFAYCSKTDPRAARALDIMNRVVKSVAEGGRFIFVDQKGLIPPVCGEYFVDNWHFSKEGNEEMAKNFADRIIKSKAIDKYFDSLN